MGHHTRSRTDYPRELFEPFDYVIAPDRQVPFDVHGVVHGSWGLFGAGGLSGSLEGYSRMNVLAIGVSKRGKNPDDVDKYPTLKQRLGELEEGRRWQDYSVKPVEELNDWMFVQTFIVGAGIEGYDFQRLRRVVYDARIENMLNHVDSPNTLSSESSLYLDFVKRLVGYASTEEPARVGELRRKAGIKSVEENITAARKAIEEGGRSRKLIIKTKSGKAVIGKKEMRKLAFGSARQFLQFASDNIKREGLDPDMFKEVIRSVNTELSEAEAYKQLPFYIIKKAAKLFGDYLN